MVVCNLIVIELVFKFFKITKLETETETETICLEIFYTYTKMKCEELDLDSVQYNIVNKIKRKVQYL